MQLIEAVKKEEAEGVVKESLEAIESDLGFIPNGMAVAANSQASLKMMFAIDKALEQGELPDNQLETARKSGLSDSVIIEIISNVISAMYGNYINHVAKTDIDWPLCRMDL